MSSFAGGCYEVFWRCVVDYHAWDEVGREAVSPYEAGSLEGALYEKGWVDAVQWHLEDLVREEGIEPSEGLRLKRWIDRMNARRTALVEGLDERFAAGLRGVAAREDARLNTESVGWALDRLSILALKVYHMGVEAGREEAGREHVERCREKLRVLEGQREFLTRAIDELWEDVLEGRRVVRGYRQVKMYNDRDLNPVLYGRGKGTGEMLVK